MRKLLTIFSLLSLSILSYAQSIFSETEDLNKTSIEINGFARAEVVCLSDNYDISNAFSEFCLKPELSKGKSFLFGDIRLREAYSFNELNTSLEIKELYIAYRSNIFDVLIGNQIITWGRTDGFNPTNIVTPINYFFLSSNPDDQKLSNFLLRSKIHFSPEIELELIAIPFYKPSIYRYDLFLSNENTIFDTPVYPDYKFQNASLAARLNFELPVAGFSFSYSTGYSSFYGFDVKNIVWNIDGSLNISNVAKTYRHNTYGADLSISIGSVILRAEGAYEHTNNYENKMHIPNPNISYVSGLEINFADITAIIQYVGKYNLNFTELEEPELAEPTNPFAQITYAESIVKYESEKFNRKIFDQQEKTNNAISLTLSRDFIYNTINSEITTYYNFTSESYLLRPMISWKIDDNITTKIGGTYMYGPDESVFNYSSPVLNGLIISLKVNF